MNHRATLLAQASALQSQADALKALALAMPEAAPSDVDALVRLKDAPVSVRTLRIAIARGELAASRVGRDLLVKRVDLASWLEARRVQPRAKRERPKAEQTAAQRAIAQARESGALRLVGAGS